MIVRYLDYLVALARKRHFARAGAVCNVTQPALSAGIKQLEESLGVRIVERRQRFLGFSPKVRVCSHGRTACPQTTAA